MGTPYDLSGLENINNRVTWIGCLGSHSGLKAAGPLNVDVEGTPTMVADRPGTEQYEPDPVGPRFVDGA
jgi:hypothetical protein